MLLRSLEIKPAKGKRRDLKKVENLVGRVAEDCRTLGVTLPGESFRICRR